MKNSSCNEEKKCWSKKLYIKQSFPDNYVDQSFLEFKKINGIYRFASSENIFFI